MLVYGVVFEQVRMVIGKFLQKMFQWDVCGVFVSEDMYKDIEFMVVWVLDNVWVVVWYFLWNIVFQNVDYGYIGKIGRMVNFIGLGKIKYVFCFFGFFVG